MQIRCRIWCRIWCRRLLLACCGPAVQDRSCAALRACYVNAVGIRDNSVLPAWCRCMRKTKAHSIHESCAGSFCMLAGYGSGCDQDKELCWPAVSCCSSICCAWPSSADPQSCNRSIRSGRNPEQADAIKADAGVHCLDWDFPKLAKISIEISDFWNSTKISIEKSTFRKSTKISIENWQSWFFAKISF